MSVIPAAFDSWHSFDWLHSYQGLKTRVLRLSGLTRQNAVVLFLGICRQRVKSLVSEDIYTITSTAAFLTVAKRWKWPRHSPTDKQNRRTPDGILIGLQKEENWHTRLRGWNPDRRMLSGISQLWNDKCFSSSTCSTWDGQVDRNSK